MKKYLIIAMVLCSVAAVSAQNKTATVTTLEFYREAIGVSDIHGSGSLNTPNTKVVYKISGAESKNFRMSIYLPGSSYGYDVFGLDKTLLLTLKSAKSPRVLRFEEFPEIAKNLESGEEKIVAKKHEFVIQEQTGILRSTLSPITVTDPAYKEPSKIKGMTPAEFEEAEGWLEEDNAFYVWTSDIKNLEDGQVTFEWDGNSNRDGKRRIIEEKESVIYVLEEIDAEGKAVKKLDILYSVALDAFYAYGNGGIGTNNILENWVGTRDMPEMAYFIVSDATCSRDGVSYEAFRDGVQGVMNFLNGRCGGGGGLIAYATGSNIQGRVKANQSSQIITTLVPGPNHSALNILPKGTYYMIRIVWHSLDPNEYTVGNGIPAGAVYFEEVKLTEDFQLGKLLDIKSPKANEFEVEWENNTPYFIMPNGEKLKAQIFGLDGRETPIDESCSCKRIYLLRAGGYTQMVVR